MSGSETNAFFRVTGGSPLTGEITPQGNKNEALPLLAVACLTGEPVTLENLPTIADVEVMQQILRTLGVRVENDHGHRTVQAARDPAEDFPTALCTQLRGSMALAGPLLVRLARVFLPKPGGDRIGRRRLDTHILALQTLGAKVDVRLDGYELWAQKLIGAHVLLDEAPLTATQNRVAKPPGFRQH